VPTSRSCSAPRGPRNVALAAEIADGWLPIFYSPERSTRLYAEPLAGAPDDFRIACPVTVVVEDDVDEALAVVKWSLAFYIGGMGAKDENFHLNVISRMGFEEEAQVVQQRFLDGDREGAMRSVPDALADEISLAGPPPPDPGAAPAVDRLPRDRDPDGCPRPAGAGGRRRGPLLTEVGASDAGSRSAGPLPAVWPRSG
jgi:alkanesulfonate monooxygenase SsuD/methylene tetrahydromethanopterin reductase-like flavin-dependent oxidoreductase (luciferase family)